jgi:hemoglobin
MVQEQRTLHEILGEEIIRRLVDRFYDIMDSLPEAQPIRAMHPSDLGSSRDKLFWFLVGWSGGPPLYVERFGHPRLRARHLPFRIGAPESAQWLLCMKLALDEVVVDEDVRAALFGAFRRIAGHMQNTEDGPAA